jgi:FKBP-type peptidyl-prolyl cis-trans isomerase
MKKVFVFPLLAMLAFSAGAQTKTAAKTGVKATAAVKPLKNNLDSLSYAFGISLGEFLKNQGVSTISYPLMNLAISQTIKGQRTYMDLNQCNAVIGKVGEEKREKVAGVEKVAGSKFLTQNKSRSGIIETATGLQYEILTTGTGPVPTLSDTISAHYRGTLLNGQEFDNSYTRGEPLSIPVAGVIPGWTEALQLMPVGSKWKLYIPSNLAYGDYGAGSDIPGGATLIFEIELLGITSRK